MGPLIVVEHFEVQSLSPFKAACRVSSDDVAYYKTMVHLTLRRKKIMSAIVVAKGVLVTLTTLFSQIRQLIDAVGFSL